MIPTNSTKTNTWINPAEPVWPPERIEALRALWKDGKSFSEIATALDTSKNAVIGKAHRLALPPRQPKERAARSRPAPIYPPPTLPRPASSPKRIGHPVKFFELQPWMCRFPLGDPRSPDFRFCGEPTVHDKTSWCADCQKVVFVVMPARMRRAA